MKRIVLVALVVFAMVLTGCNDDPTELSNTVETCLNTPSEDVCPSE